jgi:hypothetical protein
MKNQSCQNIPDDGSSAGHRVRRTDFHTCKKAQFRRFLRQTKCCFFLIFFDLRPVAVYAMNGVCVEFGEVGREVAGWDPGLAKPNFPLRIDARLIVQQKTVPKVFLA